MAAWRTLARRVPGLRPAVASLRARRVRARIGRVVPIDYPNARIVVRIASAEVERARLHPTLKEPWTVEWLEQSIRPGDVVWDVGANIGAYSLIAATLGARVVAIEPGYASYAALCENVLLNAFADRVLPLPVLLGASTQLTSISYRDVQAGAASHQVGLTQGVALPALAYGLDDLVAALEAPPPNLVKLDVDGFETQVIDGAGAALADPRLRSVLVEVDVGGAEAVVDRLAAAGLVLRQRIDARDGIPLSGIWYGVFERA